MERPAYSESFKGQMIQRLIGPEAITAQALAAESGVAQTTLSRWLRTARSIAEMAKKKASAPKKSTTKERTAAEKLRLIAAAEGLSGEALGALLRREGVHEVELEDWRRAAAEALGGSNRAVDQSARDIHAKRVKELERELNRKDKALAEVTALLVLKKKAQAFGLIAPDAEEEDDSTDGESES